MTPFYRFCRALVFPVVRLMFRTKVYGLENIPKDAPFMLCCNHTSATDALLLARFCPHQIYFMAKQELFQYPVLGSIMKRGGAFPVRRGERDITALRHACQLLKSGKVLGIFPEGTRRKSGPPREVKDGCAYIALRSSADILPVSIYREKRSFFLGKVTLRFGKLIKKEEFQSDQKISKSEIEAVSKRILNDITALWELKD